MGLNEVISGNPVDPVSPAGLAASDYLSLKVNSAWFGLGFASQADNPIVERHHVALNRLVHSAILLKAAGLAARLRVRAGELR